MDIYPLLDRIREDQLRQTGMLIDVTERQDESIRLLRGIGKLLRERPSGKRLSLPQGTVSTSMQYLAVAAAVVYLLKGGDLATLSGLLKAFGLP
jgi:hypothetical protein